MLCAPTATENERTIERRYDVAIIKTDIGRNPCDLTLLEHWNDIADVLTRAGVGLRCEKAYQAFMIIAETSRILNNHPEYDPKPEAEKLAGVARDYAGQGVGSE